MPSSRSLRVAIDAAFVAYVTKVFNVLVVEANALDYDDPAYGRFKAGFEKGCDWYDKVVKALGEKWDEDESL